MCKQKAKKKEGCIFISQAPVEGPTKSWFSIKVV